MEFGYRFYTQTLRSASDFTANTTTTAIQLVGLPAGFDITSLIRFYVKSDTPSGTSPTLDITIQGSVNNSDWLDLGAAETQLTAAADNWYVPDFLTRYMRLDLVIGGTATPTFGNLECHVSYPTYHGAYVR